MPNYYNGFPTPGRKARRKTTAPRAPKAPYGGAVPLPPRSPLAPPPKGRYVAPHPADLSKIPGKDKAEYRRVFSGQKSGRKPYRDIYQAGDVNKDNRPFIDKYRRDKAARAAGAAVGHAAIQAGRNVRNAPVSRIGRAAEAAGNTVQRRVLRGIGRTLPDRSGPLYEDGAYRTKSGGVGHVGGATSPAARAIQARATSDARPYENAIIYKRAKAAGASASDYTAADISAQVKAFRARHAWARNAPAGVLRTVAAYVLDQHSRGEGTALPSGRRRKQPKGAIVEEG